MMIDTLATGDKIHKYQRCLVVPFAGKRKVMSTSMHNGGYREDLTAVFNHDVNPGIGMTCQYCKQDEKERQRFIAEELGLDYGTVAYMATIVSMDNAVIKTASYEELTVTTIATASLEVNGGRIGEKATCHERNGQSISLRPGTINIMVFANADMTPGCMARAMITATEAKTAALQELIAGSLYSTGIATGSGTDNMMIIADAESDNLLTYAGKHGKLGELIGTMVMASVKESLSRHMGLSPESQHSMLARLKRYGITEKSFKDAYTISGGMKSVADFMDALHKIDRNGEIVALTSLYVHLLDQLAWGLLLTEEAISTGEAVLGQIAEIYRCSCEKEQPDADDVSACISTLLDRFTSVINAAALSI